MKCQGESTSMDFEWSRGAVIGVGSSGTVRLAHVRARHDVCRHLPPVLAVKSAPLAHSALLSHEHSVLLDLQGCPNVVRCFGHEVSVDGATGAETYDLFLEYVSGGSLRDVVRSCGGFLGESSVRLHARSILRGLSSVHARGYAHCDIKPQNILIDSAGSGDAKIADFGLAIKLGDNAAGGRGMRGTPLYMAPESAARGEHCAASDVWSTGCVVAEMASGRPPWRHTGNWNDGAWERLLLRIGYGDEAPEVPSQLPEEGKDFLRRCFVKDPAKRWTAEMLLQHPFVVDVKGEQINAASVEDSCRRHWTKSGSSQWVPPRSPSGSAEGEAALPSPVERIKELAAAQRRPSWSDDGCWVICGVPDHANSLREANPKENKTKKNDSNKRGRKR